MRDESHADEGKGVDDIPRADLELGRSARKRQELTAVSNLSVQRYIILILYSLRKRISLKKKKTKKIVEKICEEHDKCGCIF